MFANFGDKTHLHQSSIGTVCTVAHFSFLSIISTVISATRPLLLRRRRRKYHLSVRTVIHLLHHCTPGEYGDSCKCIVSD